MPLEIVTVPCLSDNYAYLIRCEDTDQVAVVDVPDAGPIQAALSDRGWTLDHILITHHHWDHIDGLAALRDATGASVHGGAADAHRLPPLDTELSEGDSFRLGNETCRVIDVSGHTVGHIAYIFDDALAAFTADSLMTWGCGRVFEGTKPQMWQSLCKFKDLPRAMMLYTGHEYTAANGAFALTIEPDNESYHQRMAEVQALRADGKPTVPSNLGVELATNPFLRADHPKLQAAIGMEGADPADVFAEVRTRKDNF